MKNHLQNGVSVTSVRRKLSVPKILLGAAAFALTLSSCKEVGLPDGEWETAQTTRQAKSPKRGVGYGFEYYPKYDADLLGPAISWEYNWGSSLNDEIWSALQPYNVEYCPMSWNASSAAISQIREFVQNHPGCKYLLAYNEPNLKDQSNMTPSQAAARWPSLVELADELGLQIISPAMNYGTVTGYGDPLQWLDEFFSLIGGTDKIAGISIHSYMSSYDAVRNYVAMFKKYGKPIWVTEFCGEQQSEAGQLSYMTQVVNYLEADPDVFRYAWFIPRGNTSSWTTCNLLEGSYSNSRLSDMGIMYVNMSTLDQNLYYPKGSMVPAEHYSATNLADDLSAIAPQVRVTTDGDGELDLRFLKDNWAEYGLETSKSDTYTFDFRFINSAIIDAKLAFYVDGERVAEMVFPAKTEEWGNMEVLIPLKRGKQRLRIVSEAGMMYVNWFRFKR